MLTRRYDNDDEQKDDANDDAHPHLHILPPHLLSYSVGATAEAVGLGREVVGLVLQIIQALAALRDLVDVVLHGVDGAVNLLLLRPLSVIALFIFPPLIRAHAHMPLRRI